VQAGPSEIHARSACECAAVRAVTTCRRAQRDATHKLYTADGSVESAYDDTAAPLYDTRVWLHMYEGPGGELLPSFCRRTGAAQYMYDFTGFSEWRVERNALLSDDAKCLMYKLWAASRDAPGGGPWTDVSLANVFKIRVQRALAIVKIKELEFQAVRRRRSGTFRSPRACPACICCIHASPAAHSPVIAPLPAPSGAQTAQTAFSLLYSRHSALHAVYTASCALATSARCVYVLLILHARCMAGGVAMHAWAGGTCGVWLMHVQHCRRRQTYRA
jgi:hypothetical protein